MYKKNNHTTTNPPRRPRTKMRPRTMRTTRIRRMRRMGYRKEPCNNHPTKGIIGKDNENDEYADKEYKGYEDKDDVYEDNEDDDNDDNVENTWKKESHNKLAAVGDEDDKVMTSC